MNYSTQQLTDINDYTVEDIVNIKAIAEQSAKTAQHDFLQQWNDSTGGNAYGEPVYCGFAWANIYGIKGNTKLGRAMKAAGYEQDYTRAFSIWNPSGLGTQCMSTKEKGAYAAAQVFKDAGFTAYAGSRAD